MYVRVHAIPGAKKESVTKEDDAVFRIAVREPAERNLANGRIMVLLARALGVRESAVRMVSGHRSTAKVFRIETGFG